MRGVNRDRREHGIDPPLVKSLGSERGFGVELGNGKDANGLLREGREDFVVPAFVLVANENVHAFRNFGEFLFSGEAVGADALGALLDFLEETGNADFNKLIEIVGSNGKKLYPLKKRVTRIARFFEYTAIEFEPLDMAIEVVARVFEANSGHIALFAWSG